MGKTFLDSEVWITLHEANDTKDLWDKIPVR